MDNKYTYQIQEHEIYQTELTIGQDEDLLLMIDEVQEKFKKFDFKKTGFKGALQILIKNNLIERLLKIILRGPVDQIDIREITNTELGVIVDHFLELNGGFVERLKPWFKSLKAQVQVIAK